MEGYFERVVEALIGAGYRWYETANFCRPDGDATRARHNLALLARARLPRRRDRRGLDSRRAALAERAEPAALPGRAWHAARRRRASWRSSTADAGARAPDARPAARRSASVRRGRGAVEADALARLEALGLAGSADGGLALTERGRFLGGAVTAELLA